MEISAENAVAGADLARPLDALFINAPLRDYSLRARVNDFTLPVLGMGYIATYAARQGFNVGVIDAEALGLGVEETTALVNELSPRWAGFNLLAPTYEISARIAAGLDQAINIVVGGHQAKAMPTETLADPRFARLEALVLGEGETRVVELLKDKRTRTGVEPPFLWQLNQYADKPDLTIILTGQPGHARTRAEQRGTYSRFHRGGTTAGVVEDRLYKDVAHKLTEAGYAVLHYQVKDEPAEAVAAVLLDALLERLAERSG